MSTPQRDREIIRLRQEGKSYKAIAAAVGMSEAGVYKRCVRVMGFRWPDAQTIRRRDDEIERLRREGVPYRKIAEAVGMSLSGVYKRCIEKQLAR